MQRTLLTAAPALVVSVLLGVAAAQTDHLECYKVKDPLRIKGPPPSWLDLTGPQFGSEQCRIVGGFRLFCVNVTKTVTAPLERKIAPGSYLPFTPQPVGGLLEQDRLCYKVRCSGSDAPATVQVTDQFGTRQLESLKPYLLCGPAEKGLATTTTSLPPSTTSTSSTATSTTSTTSTTQLSCCAAGGFLSLTTNTNGQGSDAGDNRSDTLFVTVGNPNLTVGGLFKGGGDQAAPLPHLLPGGTQIVTEILSMSLCSATLGPTTSVQTGSNRNCSAPGCLVGAPLPIVNLYNPAVGLCLIPRVASAVSGTSDCCTGSIDLALPLVADVYLTGDQNPAPGTQPCPLCQGSTCAGGPNNGMACTSDSTVASDAYPTSSDCPPSPGQLVATVDFAQNLTTSTVTWTGTDATNDAGLFGNQPRVFCGYCRDFEVTKNFESPVRACWQNGMAVGAPCTQPFESCEQRHGGAFGPSGHTVRTITAIGTPAPGICNPADARLATIFCFPPTLNAAIDTSTSSHDLPGPAAAVVSATTRFCPVANPCP